MKSVLQVSPSITACEEKGQTLVLAAVFSDQPQISDFVAMGIAVNHCSCTSSSLMYPANPPASFNAI